MPSIPIYLDERTYWKVSKIAVREDVTIAKAVQLIVKSYFEALEKKESIYEVDKQGETREEV